MRHAIGGIATLLLTTTIHTESLSQPITPDRSAEYGLFLFGTVCVELAGRPGEMVKAMEQEGHEPVTADGRLSFMHKTGEHQWLIHAPHMMIVSVSDMGTCGVSFRSLPEQILTRITSSGNVVKIVEQTELLGKRVIYAMRHNEITGAFITEQILDGGSDGKISFIALSVIRKNGDNDLADKIEATLP